MTKPGIDLRPSDFEHHSIGHRTAVAIAEGSYFFIRPNSFLQLCNKLKSAGGPAENQSSPVIGFEHRRLDH